MAPPELALNRSTLRDGRQHAGLTLISCSACVYALLNSSWRSRLACQIIATASVEGGALTCLHGLAAPAVELGLVKPLRPHGQVADG
jgi:hypothetical protein